MTILFKLIVLLCMVGLGFSEPHAPEDMQPYIPKIGEVKLVTLTVRHAHRDQQSDITYRFSDDELGALTAARDILRNHLADNQVGKQRHSPTVTMFLQYDLQDGRRRTFTFVMSNLVWVGGSDIADEILVTGLLVDKAAHELHSTMAFKAALVPLE